MKFSLFRWIRAIGFVLILHIATLLSSSAQRLDYLNSYWYEIQDSSKYPISHYRITLSDSVRKSVRIFTLDSILVYQRLEILAQKRQPMTKTEIWYSNGGKKTRVSKYFEKKKREEVTRYYDSGEIESLKVTESDKIIEETYFSRTGHQLPKPEVIQASPKNGIMGWNDFLRQNLVYPEDARFLGKEGVVYLHFYVTQEGKMEEIEIMNPEENHPSLTKEALRVTASYPHLWSPSIENGVVKKSEMRLPIRFKLTD